eukprot:gene1355-1785_t
MGVTRIVRRPHRPALRITISQKGLVGRVRQGRNPQCVSAAHGGLRKLIRPTKTIAISRRKTMQALPRKP